MKPFRLNRIIISSPCLSMISPDKRFASVPRENRFPLLRIMLHVRERAQSSYPRPDWIESKANVRRNLGTLGTTSSPAVGRIAVSSPAGPATFRASRELAARVRPDRLKGVHAIAGPRARPDQQPTMMVMTRSSRTVSNSLETEWPRQCRIAPLHRLIGSPGMICRSGSGPIEIWPVNGRS
jgi:hypothetical protein